MTEKINKNLTPYQKNNKQVQGKYHFELDEGLELGCYPMNIHYESTDESKPDAYDYDGFVVVGHRSYLRTSPVIVPFNTNASLEENVTLTEKRNTGFNVIVDALSNLTEEVGISGLPIHVKFVKGEFKDYHASPSTYPTVIETDFEEGVIPETLPPVLTTSHAGRSTLTVKVSDLYNADETISDLNTVIFKCRGTLDRGSDNYIPSIIETPVIIGTTHVYVSNILTNTRRLTIGGSEKTVNTTCGKGELTLGCKLYYKAFMRDDTVNHHMKYHYEDYRTDNNKFVKVGSLQLQYSLGDGWITVPADELVPADNYTTVKSDGTITQKQGDEQGAILVKWTNSFESSMTQIIKYRWVYTGKAGATYGVTPDYYYLGIAPEFGVPAIAETSISLDNSTISIRPNETKNITGSINSAVSPLTGEVMVTLPNGSIKRVTVDPDGTFSLPINNIPVGSHRLTVSFEDQTRIFDDSSADVTVNCEKYSSAIVFEDLINDTLSVDYKKQWTINGKIVVKNGNTVIDTVVATGVITPNNFVTSNLTRGSFTYSNVGSDGTIVKNVGSLSCTLTYEGNDNIAGCSKTITIKTVPVDVNIIMPTENIDVWDSGIADSDNFDISIKDKNGLAINEGHFDVSLQPPRYATSVNPVTVWSTEVTTRNDWHYNGYRNLDFHSLFEVLKSRDYLIYTGYKIVCTYSCTSGNYNNKTVTSTVTLNYKCKAPKLVLETVSTYQDNNTITPPPPSRIEITEFNGWIRENLTVANDCTMKLNVYNGKNERIGGIQNFYWFINETKTITIYQMNDDGTYVLDNEGHKIENTTENYEDSNVPISPCHPYYPVPLGFMEKTPENRTSYTQDTTFHWISTGDQLLNQNRFYMYIVFDRYLNNIFPNASTSITQPYDSIKNGVDSNHVFVNPVTGQYSVSLKLKLNIYKLQGNSITDYATTLDGFNSTNAIFYASTKNCSKTNNNFYNETGKCLYTICDDVQDGGTLDDEGVHAPTGVVLYNKNISTTSNCDVSFKVKFKANSDGRYGGHFGLAPLPASFKKGGYNSSGGYIDGCYKDEAERAPARYEFNKILTNDNAYLIHDNNANDVKPISNFRAGQWYTMHFIIQNGSLTARCDELSDFSPDSISTTLPEGLHPYFMSFINNSDCIIRELKFRYF